MASKPYPRTRTRSYPTPPLSPPLSYTSLSPKNTSVLTPYPHGAYNTIYVHAPHSPHSRGVTAPGMLLLRCEAPPPSPPSSPAALQPPASPLGTSATHAGDPAISYLSTKKSEDNGVAGSISTGDLEDHPEAGLAGMRRNVEGREGGLEEERGTVGGSVFGRVTDRTQTTGPSNRKDVVKSVVAVIDGSSADAANRNTHDSKFVHQKSEANDENRGQMPGSRNGNGNAKGKGRMSDDGSAEAEVFGDFTAGGSRMDIDGPEVLFGASSVHPDACDPGVDVFMDVDTVMEVHEDPGQGAGSTVTGMKRSRPSTPVVASSALSPAEPLMKKAKISLPRPPPAPLIHYKTADVITLDDFSYVNPQEFAAPDFHELTITGTGNYASRSLIIRLNPQSKIIGVSRGGRNPTLLLTEVIRRMKELIQVDVDLMEFFTHPVKASDNTWGCRFFGVHPLAGGRSEGCRTPEQSRQAAGLDSLISSFNKGRLMQFASFSEPRAPDRFSIAKREDKMEIIKVTQSLPAQWDTVSRRSMRLSPIEYAVRIGVHTRSIDLSILSPVRMDALGLLNRPLATFGTGTAIGDGMMYSVVERESVSLTDKQAGSLFDNMRTMFGHRDEYTAPLFLLSETGRSTPFDIERRYTTDDYKIIERVLMSIRARSSARDVSQRKFSGLFEQSMDSIDGLTSSIIEYGHTKYKEITFNPSDEPLRARSSVIELLGDKELNVVFAVRVLAHGLSTGVSGDLARWYKDLSTNAHMRNQLIDNGIASMVQLASDSPFSKSTTIRGKLLGNVFERIGHLILTAGGDRNWAQLFRHTAAVLTRHLPPSTGDVKKDVLPTATRRVLEAAGPMPPWYDEAATKDLFGRQLDNPRLILYMGGTAVKSDQGIGTALCLAGEVTFEAIFLNLLVDRFTGTPIAYDSHALTIALEAVFPVDHKPLLSFLASGNRSFFHPVPARTDEDTATDTSDELITAFQGLCGVMVLDCGVDIDAAVKGVAGDFLDFVVASKLI